jgi:paraquat-inducible protein A
MSQSPQSAQPSHRIGCPECDLLVRVAAPCTGETARCPRCGCALASGVRDGFGRPLAYAVTALMLMVIALAFPFLSVHASGLGNAMTLAAAVTSLTAFGANAIAVLVAAFVLLVPAAMMVASAALTALLLTRRSSPLLTPPARTLFHLDTWCMADVFAVGVIVSLVKLSSMADVALGLAFWAYLGFAVCFLLSVTNLDRLAVWSAIDELRNAP